MNRKITRLAFGAKCGRFGASGSAVAAAAEADRASPAEQRVQRDGAEADAALLEEPAAGDLLPAFVAKVVAESHGPVPGHSLVIVSSRFSSTRATTV